MTGLANGFLLEAACGGTLGFLAVTSKKMYYDNAFSQLVLPVEVGLNLIEQALSSKGFVKDQYEVYSKSKYKFSILHQCKSEKITVEASMEQLTIRGAYEDLEIIL
ncbi:MAG: hypothetical protein RSC78_06415, partial [Acidaminococcaceae bacterium]